jgi:Cd2+/Zn2+-exporting ATPase
MEEEERSKKEEILLLVRVAITLTLVLLGIFYLNESNFSWWVSLLVMGSAWLIIAYDIVWKAFKELFLEKNPFNEYMLMTIASVGAFCLRLFGADHNEYAEGVLVMLLYQIGEFFEDFATDKSRKAITDAIDLRDEKASVILPDGTLVSKRPEELAVGDVCLMKVGEKILCDGEIIEGEASIDESSLTGEFVPVDKKVESPVLSGTIVRSGSIKVKVTKPYADSTVAKLLDLVENSASKKSKADRFISRFSKIYTPVVMILAILVACLPPLFLGVNDGAVWSRWIYTALCFLVIACPCAIVISVPLAYFAGLGLASKNGIVVKGAEYFDKLNHLAYVAFDKTGTLTTGQMRVNLIKPIGISESEFMEYLLAAECRSTHPIARAICEGHDLSKINQGITAYEEVSGFGVRVTYKGHVILAGKINLLNAKALDFDPSKEPGSVTYIAVDNSYKGYIILNDILRENCGVLIQKLQQKGVKTILLSGDREANVKAAAESLHIDEWHSDLIPEEKTEVIHQKIDSNSGTIAYLGDGINDAPSIVLADVGIAMGGLGSDMAIANADLVLMNDDPSKVLTAITIAHKTETSARVNIIVALAIKLGVMITSLVWTGFPLWAAVLADTGLTVLLVLNSLALNFAKIRNR